MISLVSSKLTIITRRGIYSIEQSTYLSMSSSVIEIKMW